MKRGKKSRKPVKRNEKELLDFDLQWGIKGLLSSLVFLLVLIVILLGYLIISQGSFFNIFSLPSSGDFLAIFAGVLIFIAIPFVLGIRIGMVLRNSK